MNVFRRIKNSRILKKQSISEATLIMVIIIFLSKIIGYTREVLVAYYFGATAKTDAFLIAFLVPSMVLGLIAGGIQIVIIPLYTEKKKISLQRAHLFVNQVFLITVFFLIVLSALMYLFPTFFIKIVAYGFKGNRLSLAVYFMRYLIIFGFFNVFIGFFTGLYQAEKQFLYPALIGLIGNSFIPIMLIALTPLIGINSWTVAEIAFSTFSFFAMFIILRWKRGFFGEFALKHIDWKEMAHFANLLFPIILTSSLFTINNIVDKTVASSLSTGSIAILNFAQKIYLIPFGLLIAPLNISTYPTLSSLAASKNYKGYANLFQQSITLILFVMIPISVLFIVLSQPIIRILFQHGAFTSKDTVATAFTVSMYSIGLFMIAANDFLRRVFFSFKNTKTPLYISSVIVSINVVGDIVLSRFLGVVGIALATSTAVTIGFLVYLTVLIKMGYLTNVHLSHILIEFIKIVSVSIIIGVIAFFLKGCINNPKLILSMLHFTVVSIVLLICYLALTYLIHSGGNKISLFYFKKFAKIFVKINRI